MVLALAVAGCTGASASAWERVPLAAEPASANTEATTSEPAVEPDVDIVGAIEIEAFDIGFDPSVVSVPAAGTYEVTLNNTGQAEHDLTFADGTKIVAPAGTSATTTVSIPADGLTFICSVPGHEAAGMTGEVTVEAAAPDASGVPAVEAATPEPSAPAGSSDDHGGPEPTGTVEADPNAPPYVPYDPTAPAPLPGTTHDIDLVITERLMTVAPGFSQKVWTFGGTVPGPVIRVKVGDTIRVHLKNPETNQLSHSIDFHSSQVAWNDEMRSIAPGEELVYEWTADYAGVWMYHCGTAPVLHHIANGMYGMVIVEPAEGLPPVDKEFALVQSEWYLGPQGTGSDLEKAMAAAPAPDLVLFNGVADQYKDHPLGVETGERVRVFILNAGPSVDSSFHIVGTIFDTVRKEGVSLSPGDEGGWGSQAMDLAPAQGGYVEFTTAEDGLYPIVTHAFNLVGRGALGLVQAGDGDPSD
jgi:nitrite reductase (NO-forming)